METTAQPPAAVVLTDDQKEEDIRAGVGELWRSQCEALEKRFYPVFPLLQHIGPRTSVHIGGSGLYNLGGGRIPPAISVFLLMERAVEHDGRKVWRVATNSVGFDAPHLLKEWTDAEAWEVVESLLDWAEEFFATPIGPHDLLLPGPGG